MATIPSNPTPIPYSRPTKLVREGSRALGADAVLSFLARGSAVVILLMMALLLVVLFRAAPPSIATFGSKFLVTSSWRPNELEVVKRNAAGKMIDEAGNVTTDMEEAAKTI